MSSPALTVVVPAVNTVDDLRGCLEALAAQRDDVEVEAIVVNRIGSGASEETQRHDWVREIPVETSVTIPQMRAMAFREARGDAVAVLEDHVIVPPGWARAMLDALEDNPVIGGSVDNAATDTLMDWAAFLCEYHHCIPPIDGGDVSWLTGNNVVYRRELLERHRAAAEDGKWENHLHEAFRQDGVKLICRPEIVVGHKKHYTFGEYMSQRYLYARSYAGARVADAPISRRIVFGLGALVLPALLMLRIVRKVTEKRRYNGLLVKSTPLIALFVLSWAFGEMVGYFAGPGNSLSRVC